MNLIAQITVYSIVAVWLAGAVNVWRIRRDAARQGALLAAQAGTHAAVTEWARHTMLTVITHTGTEFSTSLEELRTSDNPARSWNVPLQVTLWNDIEQENANQAREMRPRG